MSIPERFVTDETGTAQVEVTLLQGRDSVPMSRSSSEEMPGEPVVYSTSVANIYRHRPQHDWTLDAKHAALIVGGQVSPACNPPNYYQSNLVDPLPASAWSPTREFLAWTNRLQVIWAVSSILLLLLWTSKGICGPLEYNVLGLGW